MVDIMKSDAMSVIRISEDPVTGLLVATKTSVSDILEHLAVEGIRIPITVIR